MYPSYKLTVLVFAAATTTLVLCSTWCFSFLYGMSGDWEFGHLDQGFVFQAGLKWCLVVPCLALFKIQWFKAAVSPREEAAQHHCNGDTAVKKCHLWDSILCLYNTEECPWSWVAGGCRCPSGSLHCQGEVREVSSELGCAWSALQSEMLLHQLWASLSCSATELQGASYRKPRMCFLCFMLSLFSVCMLQICN